MQLILAAIIKKLYGKKQIIISTNIMIDSLVDMKSIEDFRTVAVEALVFAEDVSSILSIVTLHFSVFIWVYQLSFCYTFIVYT